MRAQELTTEPAEITESGEDRRIPLYVLCFDFRDF
jgi:hypothetical protein